MGCVVSLAPLNHLQFLEKKRPGKYLQKHFIASTKQIPESDHTSHKKTVSTGTPAKVRVCGMSQRVSPM